MSVVQLGRQQAWHRLAASLRPVQRQTLIHRIYDITPPAFRTRPGPLRSYHLLRQPVSQGRKRISSNIAKTRRRWNSSSAETEVAAKPESQLTLGQRMKKLSREYGWTAVGVYFALSVLDFPFCFLAVRWIGTDTIGHWEHVIVERLKAWIPWGQKDTETVPSGGPVEVEQRRVLEDDETYLVTEHGYKEAEKANAGSDASKSSWLRDADGK